MKLNSQVIFLIAIVGIIVVGVVGATMLSNGPMKQVDFDGIKVSVPSDADFIKTADGYADSKYGITIHIFKNNNSIVNFLKSVNGGRIIALKNQPPQSVAFAQGDDTNVVITNGAEGICIGAKDQGLVTDMSNSVVFSNHQKSVKPQVSIPAIIAPPHLELHRDFNLINAIIVNVNNDVFNAAIFEQNINGTINEYNVAVDTNVLEQYTTNEFTPNSTAGGVATNNNTPQNTSLYDNPQASGVVQSLSSDSNNAASSGSNGGAVPSVSSDGQGSSSSPASSSPSTSAPASGDSASSGGNNQKQKLTLSEIEDAVKKALPSGYTIDGTPTDEGSYYLFKIKDPSGKIQKMKFDAYDGHKIN